MKLSDAIEKYVEMKRMFGVTYRSGAGIFYAFLRQTGDVPINSVTKSHVLGFLDRGRASDVTWMVKYQMLRAFFHHWMARGVVGESPMPRPKAASVRLSVLPYIYSVSDMRRLLWGTCFMKRLSPRVIDPATLRAVLIFLYGTGARIDETLALEQSGVDLKNDTVTFHRSTQYSRTIPIGTTLGQWLRTYSVSQRNDAQNFFAGRDGKPIKPQTLIKNFESVRRRMGVSRNDGIDRRPQLRDLRRTFAVDCLRKWIEQDKDLPKMLPILAAYLGHADLSSTEAYLSLAPNRFSKQLSSLKCNPVLPTLESSSVPG
jgi:integrase